MIKADAEKLFYQAVNKFEQGDIPAAADLFSEVVFRFPDFGKSYNYLGVIYFIYFKDSFTAESQFKKAIASSPEFTESYINYAALLLSQERFAEMNAQLNKVSEISDVKKNKIFEQFGLMNEIQGKYDDAVDFFKRAIAYTFSDDELASYEKAINRCQTKKKYL